MKKYLLLILLIGGCAELENLKFGTKSPSIEKITAELLKRDQKFLKTVENGIYANCNKVECGNIEHLSKTFLDIEYRNCKQFHTSGSKKITNCDMVLIFTDNSGNIGEWKDRLEITNYYDDVKQAESKSNYSTQNELFETNQEEYNQIFYGKNPLDKYKKYKKYFKSVKSQKVVLGMPERLVYLSIGYPEKINRTLVRGLEHKQLVYSLGEYVYIRNGKVVGIQD